MIRRSAALVLLYLSATLVLAGGCYDLLVPSPPPHHLDFLGVSQDEIDPRAVSLLAALLRALGGALIGVGIGALFLINRGISRGHGWAAAALILLIGVTEGVNAVQMYGVGSPYWAPLTFIGLLFVGVALSYVPSRVFQNVICTIKNLDCGTRGQGQGQG